MSDISDNEPDGAGTGSMSRIANTVRSMFSLKAPGMDEANKQIVTLNQSIAGLERALAQLSAKQYQLSSGINRMMESITKSAKSTTTAVQQMSGALGGVGGGGGGTTATPGGTATASGAIAAAQQQSGMFSTSSGSLSSFLTGAPTGAGIKQVGMGLLQDLAMAPLRFLTGRIEQNRELATGSSVLMGGQAYAYNQQTPNLMTGMSRMPGNVYGSPSDILNLFGIARGAGAMTNLGMFGTFPQQAASQGFGYNAPRAAGFLQGVHQMQMMTPGAPVSQMAGTLAGQGANIGSQQMGAFYTGGAFSLVGQGGRQKSVQEWAESILRWLEGLRPGKDKGKGFTHVELISQYYPGSNIDAWFTAMGIDAGMREYWWTYALGKASRTTSTADKGFVIKAEKNDIAQQRLLAQSALTRTEFGLAGTMAGQYANKEQANRWFNEIMGQVMQQVIPSVTTKGALASTQFLPDDIQKLFMRFLEGTGPIGAGIGGAIGWGGISGILNVFQGLLGGVMGGAQGLGSQVGGLLNQGSAFGQLFPSGDVGDWGPMGGTSTAGMHPDMRRRMDSMMQANPRLRVNSGLRDLATQQKLRGKGYSRVSGKASAHTRGMAADMGPPSEYPWLVANARKFGLKSGVGAGEPWHVGMGDVGDEADIGFLSALWQMFGGVGGGGGQGLTGPQSISAVGSIIPSLINLLIGTLGAGADKPLTPGQEALLQFDPTVYHSLVRESSKGYTFGGLIPTMGIPGLPGRGGDVTGGDIMATVEAAHRAKFTGQALVNLVAIAGRESSFNPLAHRTDSGQPDNWDKGDRGLWQINETHTQSLINAGIIRSSEDLKDSVTNAKAAYLLSSGGTNRDILEQLWGADENGWVGRGGDPFYNTDLDAARAAVRKAGYIGDVDAYAASGGGGSRTSLMTFNNTFVINGGSGGPNGGIDVRRSASAIADQLEAEMKRRMARRN